MTGIPIPRSTQPIAGQEFADAIWYSWFQRIDEAANSGVITGDEAIAAIYQLAIILGSPDGTIANIPPQGNDAQFVGNGPINVQGTLDQGIITITLNTLANTGIGALLAITRDEFGRVSGTKAATITGTPGEITVVSGDAVAGLPTLSLAAVADAGGGTLQKTAFDTKGRKTGTSAATTDNLTEGVTNLYFTAARVLATVLAGLSTATNAAITAADTVLSAMGKLQAQITANLAAIGLKADKSITISTTAPLTGGGDLSANRTFAMPVATNVADGYLSAADRTAFNAKEPAIAAGTTAQFYRGDKAMSNALIGPLGIGVAPTVGYNFEMNLNVTGAVAARYMSLSGAIQSDVTNQARVFESVPSTAAAAFTLSNLYNFFVNQGTFGAGSTVTNQFGYYVSSTMIGATNNYGFYSNLAAATGRYNIYMPGTADNYLGGRLGIGSASTVAQSLRMGLNLTGAASSYGAVQAGVIQSDVTTAGVSYYSGFGTAAANFTVSVLRHYATFQGTIGVGSTVANQQGFYADANLVGATNNYGAYLNLPAIPVGSGTVARTITTVDVTTNVVTVTTSAAHGFITGQRVTVAATTNTGINGSGQVIASTPTTTTFTYARTLANITSVADTGTVTPAANWNIHAVGTAPNYLAGPLLIGSTTDDTVNKLQVTGNIATQAIGNGFRIKEGTNAKMGVATLVAGTVTVSNTSVTANSRIFIDSNTGGGTPGWLRISARTAGTSFTILSSSATDTSVVAWVIFEPT